MFRRLFKLGFYLTKSNKRFLNNLQNHLNQTIGEINHQTENNSSNVNRFVTRTHTCGQLSELNVGQTVRLCGWIQHQRYGKFIVLRDSYGITQLISDKKLVKKIAKLPSESVVEVSGVVTARPPKDVNPLMKTGSIEVLIDEMQVLNKSQKDLPFTIRDYKDPKESLCLKYRYIDLRCSEMQYNLRMRSKVIMNIRNFLTNNYGFVEVETPTLFNSTPTGAQEFVVPTVLADNFYSLVQSPQQLKQLLMIGGIDRYFQIARCYRDEGTKSDRQPEFTQLDLEMSFTTDHDIMCLIEELIAFIWPIDTNTERIITPFKRIKYCDAMRDYGTDKPDLRSDIKLKEINNFPLFDASSNLCCVSLVIPNVCNELNDSIKILINEMKAIKHQLKFVGNLMYTEIDRNLNWNPLVEIPVAVIKTVENTLTLKANDFLWIAYGDKYHVYRLLGRIRADCVKAIEKLNESQNGVRKLSLLWVVDFPLFLPLDNNSDELESCHHPFTSPLLTEIELLYTNPKAVHGQHFDLVINGQEVGGGSVRIHDSEMQEYVLKNILKTDTTHMQYFLDALKSGCPPHGGIALGLDRLLAIICNALSIRDVIAFPKSANGKDLMSGAPSPISDHIKKFYHIYKS